MTALDNLISQLEAATGPSRELDAEVANAAGAEAGFIGKLGWRMRFATWMSWSDHRWCALPRYTASIDAAITLVPEGAVWTVLTDYGDLCRARIFNAEPELHVEEDGATPALALCIACLRARAAVPQP